MSAVIELQQYMVRNIPNRIKIYIRVTIILASFWIFRIFYQISDTYLCVITLTFGEKTKHPISLWNDYIF